MAAEPMTEKRLRIGMVGLGMIFDETYRPVFEQLQSDGLHRCDFGNVNVELAAVATRTGRRAEQLNRSKLGAFESFHGDAAIPSLVSRSLQAVCIASPDDRHFEAARAALAAGKHVLIEKPSVLRLQELDQLASLANSNGVLAKVVYHKLFDPDHKALRTRVADGILRHVNSGYCSLLEPKRISRDQFAEWIVGRNPGSYVAVHYLKLVDFTFANVRATLRVTDLHAERDEYTWRLVRVHANGQRGQVGTPNSDTWDSVQLHVVYEHPDGREAAFDIQTSWVAPDEFPGSVEQEVQFRFDNGVWNAHQRKRGVEVVVEGRPASEMPITPNHHYNADCLEPWGERRRRGYGLEAIRRFFEEVAFVEFGGSQSERIKRLNQMRALTYNDLLADRNVVAAVQGLEAILARHAAGQAGCHVTVNTPRPGLWLFVPGQAEPECLYGQSV